MLEDFFQRIFGDNEGYVHVALFKNGRPAKRQFVEWPKDRRKLNSLDKAGKLGDIYFSPALYSRAEATRAACLGTAVTWVDMDSHTEAQDLDASMVVASGTPGHVHAYWSAGKLLTPAEAESWNYLNCITHGADMGGWDVVQLLRVPETFNHKTRPPTPVKLLELNDTVAKLPTGLELVRVPKYDKPDILPALDTVLESHDLSDATRSVLSIGRASDRSGTMFRLACLLSEDGLSPDESYVVIAHIDERWGKFGNRNDRQHRLEQLVARAYEKTLNAIEIDSPEPVQKPELKGLQPVGWRSLAKDLPAINWLIDDILRDKGFMMLAGPSGVGKSQLAIGLAAKLVLGADNWAGFNMKPPTTQQRILYLSLEMDQHGVQYTTSHMEQLLPQEQLHILDTNLLFHATLEPFKLDIEHVKGRRTARYQVEEYLKLATEPLTGIIVDTLGASTSKGLMDEIAVRNTIDWFKHLRTTYGLWITLLAHPRKESSENKRKVITLDDIYGNQAQQADLDAAFILTKVDGQRGLLRLSNQKTRFGPEKDSVILRRTQHLWLEKTSEIINVPSKGKADDFDLVDDSFELEGLDL